MLTDESTCANSATPFLPYTNGHGSVFNGSFMNNGYIRRLPPAFDNANSLNNVRKEIFDAIFAPNGQMGNGSVFSESEQAYLQHVMSANPALMNMKLWLQEVVLPDEVRLKSSVRSSTVGQPKDCAIAHFCSRLLGSNRGPFLESPGTFGTRKAIFSSSVSKKGEMYTTETSCMKGTSFHLQDMSITTLQS